MEASTFGERYSARQHELPIKSYRLHVSMLLSAIAQLVLNYREFPAGSDSGFILVIYDSW